MKRSFPNSMVLRFYDMGTCLVPGLTCAYGSCGSEREGDSRHQTLLLRVTNTPSPVLLCPAWLSHGDPIRTLP